MLTYLLRPLLCDGLRNIDSNPKVNLKTWIGVQNYEVTDISDDGSFELYVKDLDEIHLALAGEINRYSTASLESFFHAFNGIPLNEKSLGWICIELYYSAFYSAHATLRGFSKFCSHLEGEQINLINKIATIYLNGKSISGSRGLFEAELDVRTKLLKFRKLSDPHVDTWKTFNKLLSEIATNTLTVPGLAEDKRSIILFIESLQQLMSSGGAFQSGNWLSSMRNSINYKLSHDLWFPYGGDSFKKSEVDQILKLWNRDPLSIPMPLSEKREIKKFVYLCTIIISFQNSFANEIFSFKLKRKGFIEYGPFSFLKRHSIKFAA